MTKKDSTRRSIWYNAYYLLEQALISGIISGGSQFGIAYAMYFHPKHDITLWAFPHTMSGDCALSLFIQVGVTWYMEELTIGWDALNGDTPILPFPVSLPSRIKHKIIWWYFEIDRGIVPDEVEPQNNSFKGYMRRQFIRYPNKNWFFNLCEWAIRKTIRGVILGALMWVWEWPITMGIMAGIGTPKGAYDYKFYGYFPEVMKLIYGFVLGFASTPAAILAVMLRDQWYRLYIGMDSKGDDESEPIGKDRGLDLMVKEENPSSTIPNTDDSFSL
ncbi:YHL026C [Zygosaccharomyces parabailii]|nr:YHL026C [Zygosaccharomyces parabailii]